MEKYYETAHGWPCTLTQSQTSFGPSLRVCIDGHDTYPKRYTDTVFSVDESVIVNPDNYPNVWEFMDNFHKEWGEKFIYLKNGDVYDKFLVYPNKSSQPTRLAGTSMFECSDLYIGREAIYNHTRSVVIPYNDIPTCNTLIGLSDFTHGDLVNFWNLTMLDFIRANISSKYQWRAQLFQPRVSHKFQGKISIYMSKKDKDRERLTALRPGRAFKVMFPELNDKDIASLVDTFNRDFPIQNLTLHTGSSESDFIKAYSYEQSVMQNVNTTCARKSLANSCMRFRPEHENLPKHPAAAYASGDFLSIWTEDESGRIASRCVLYLNEGGKPQAGPVYGTTEGSIDMIEDHLQSLGAELYDNASWINARLLYIECNGGALAPYLDHEKALEVTGEYLLIVGDDEDSGDFYADTYSGVLRPSGNCCECCNERVDYGDEVHTEDGMCYCSYCYNETYGQCYESGEECRLDDMCRVRVSKYRWGWQEEYVYDPASHGYILLDDDGYYHPDLVVTTEQGNSFLIDSGCYFVCDLTDECHDIDQMVETVEGDKTSLDWVKANNYVMNEDGVYAPQEEKEAA